MTNLITLKTKDFLDAIGRLKKPDNPFEQKSKKSTKIINVQECYVSLNRTEAVFSTGLVRVHCPIISGEWKGYAMTNLASFLIFLKVKPVGKEINISYADGKITIDTLTVAGKFSDLPLWEARVDR
jgi:hypothetical protein